MKKSTVKTLWAERKPACCTLIKLGDPRVAWWNTDIGGHLMERCQGVDFGELLVRWFQYGCFTPIPVFVRSGAAVGECFRKEH